MMILNNSDLREKLSHKNGTPEELIRLYNTRRNWNSHAVQPIILHLPLWNCACEIADPESTLLAYCVGLFLRNELERCYKKAENLPLPYSILLQLAALIQAQRWDTVISMSQKWIQDVPALLQEQANLFLASAYAHLRFFREAKNSLNKVIAPHLEEQKNQLFFAIQSYENDPTNTTLTVTREDLIAARKNIWDPSTEPLLESVEVNNNQQLIEAEQQLYSLIGLEDVKKEVSILKAQASLHFERKKRGITIAPISLHLVLAGSPGTGKTTIVNIIAAIYHALGLLETAKITRVSREAFHQTQVSPGKIMKKLIQDNLGGTLFIDEAYSIFYGEEDITGKEALDTLVDQLEHYHGKICIVLAGYPHDIDRLLSENSGLRSRMTTRINFPTFTIDQLNALVVFFAHSRGNILAPTVEEFLTEHTEELYTRNTSEKTHIDILGNGRFIRNFVEAAEKFRDYRLLQDVIPLKYRDDQELQMLLREDFIFAWKKVTEQLIKGGL